MHPRCRKILLGNTGRVLRFDGTTWSPSPTGSTVHGNAVWGYAKDRAFIVGDMGTIFY